MNKRISKKELAIIFGFFSPASGRAKTQRLRDEVFTDTVLEELNISQETYRRRRTFNADQTKRIKDYFQITADDLHQEV